MNLDAGGLYKDRDQGMPPLGFKMEGKKFNGEKNDSCSNHLFS